MASSSVLGAALGARLSYRPSPAGLNKQQQLHPIPSRARPRRQRPLRVGGAAVVVRAEGAAVNPEIRKDEAKVVDSVVVSELSKPLTAYCRCWRSGTFPLCDGSHVKHNKATGDNVGPLLLKK